ALDLARRWDTLPERFPVHWGFDGQPNGWATRSLGGVDGAILIGAAVCAVGSAPGARHAGGAALGRVRGCDPDRLAELAPWGAAVVPLALGRDRSAGRDPGGPVR